MSRLSLKGSWASRRKVGARLVAAAMGIVAVTLLVSCTTGVPQTDVAKVYFDLGNAYSNLGKVDAAVTAYLHAIELDPSLASASYNLARVYLDSGQLTKGMDLLQKLLAKDPKNSILLSTLGWGKYLSGDVEGALTVYEQVLQRLPDDQNALYNAGILSQKLKKEQDALGYFKRLYNLAPSDPVLLKLGSISYDLGDTQDAVSYLATYQQKNPDDMDALVLLGKAYVDDRFYSKALDAFNEVLKNKPDDAEVLFDASEVLLKYVEDFDTGFADLQKAVENGFKDKKRLEDLLSFQNLKGKDTIQAYLETKGLIEAKTNASQ